MALYGATKFSNADMSEPTRFEENNSNVVRRLVHVTPERQQWLWEGPIGSISRAVKAPHHNHAELLQSFNNAAEHPLPIPAEGVHVAVGFVDLGVLAETLAAHQKQQSEHGQGSCLKWVGIEKSAFCCAKMLVVSHMLQQRMDAHTIAQVRLMFPAVWNHCILFLSRRLRLRNCIMFSTNAYQSAYAPLIIYREAILLCIT